MNADGRRQWTRLIPAAYSLVLALVVLGPLVGPGYLLLRDAVSTPRSYLTDSALGLGDAAPRAVPQDALIATLSPLIDGGLLVKAILLAALWLAGCGAATLARHLLHVTTGPQLVAATVAIWNPYVAERLLQGHWSLLTGYAALPWIALLATRLRTAHTLALDSAMASNIPGAERDPAKASPHATPIAEQTVATPQSAVDSVGSPAESSRSAVWTGVSHAIPSRTWPIWGALGGWLAAAGLTPTGSLLAGCVAFLLVGKRNLLGALGLWIAASAPWLAATVLAGSGAEPSDPAGVAAFAARAEPWLGTLGSLAGLGGIWNSTAVPDSRTTFFALVGTVLLLAVAGTGVRSVLGRAKPRMATGAADITASRAEADVGGAEIGSRTGEFTSDDSGAIPASARPSHRASEAADVENGGALSHTETNSSPTESDSAAAAHTRRLFAGLAEAAHTRRVLAGLAVAAIALPALGATGWGHSAGEFLVTKVPGAGLLRDTQKFVALAMPAFTLCAAAGCRVVAGWIATRRDAADAGVAGSTFADQGEFGGLAAIGGSGVATGREPSAGQSSRRGPVGVVAAVFVVLVLISLPDMAWGVGGALRPVKYPGGWERVAALVQGPGDVAVLPGGMFRKFRWAGGAPVLDPAPRMLPRDVLQTGELPVQGATVSGEGARALEVERLLSRGGSAQGLARLGVGWVLVEAGTPGPMGESKTALGQLNSVYADRDLQLYRVPGSITAHDASAGARRVAGAAHLLWAVLLCGGIVSVISLAGIPARNRRRSVQLTKP
ncbi:hypothetical protein [Nocardia sp. SYP-A9097]|uniref:hypothetical protein n=1 Tax=Nocardia sp. SYP-A9097 TaxID=2663237 RepID=UPI0028163732|nr:hypothetical protein [Nocardia sp. SYP-A9097]